MSKIIITCGDCGAEREVDAKLAGSVLECSECQASVRVPLPNISKGTNLGGFVLERQLGFGAMGEVWLARQTAMDRLVAVKLLAREYTLDSKFIDRFLKEVKISAKMDHPNIVTAFDAGCENDIYYLALTYVDGCTLEDKIEELGKLPEQDALKLGAAIADALGYAWNNFSILHRDIKPANIMIDKTGVAKLMDMGISKVATETAGLTMTGTIVGTPYYMSPEQGMGEKELDFRSDIYSLGATLYHAVTGELPFDATTALGIVSKHITEPLPSPLDRNPNLSEQCSALIEIMMAKGAADRQGSWEEVVNDMRLVLNGEFPASKPRPSPGDSLIMPAAHSKPTVVDSSGDAEALAEPPASHVGEGESVARRSSRKGALLAVVASAIVLAAGVAAVLFLNSNSDESGADDLAVLESAEGARGAASSESVSAEEADGATFRNQSAAKDVAETPRSAERPGVDRCESRMVELEEMWRFAKKYSEENPGKYDLAIKNFTELSKVASGTKYKMMADVAAADLRERKRKAVAASLAELERKCETLAAGGDFAKAAELCELYSGEFAEETKERRTEMAVGYRERGRKWAEAEKRRREAAERERENAKLAVSKAFVSGDWERAGEILRKTGVGVPGSKALLKVAEELMNARKTFVAELRKHVGDYVNVRGAKGVRKVKIKKVKGRFIYCVETKGRVSLQRKYPVSRISKEDVFRIAGLSGNAVLAFEVAALVKKGGFTTAGKKLSRMKTPFARFLERGVAELNAEELFKRIMAALGVDCDEVKDPGELLELVRSAKLESRDLRRMISEYRDQASGTEFLAARADVLRVLEERFAGEGEGGEPAGNSERSNRRVSGVDDEFIVPDFDPASIKRPEDMDDLLRRAGGKYDGGGKFFFDRRGELVMVDLYGVDGVDDATLRVIASFPSVQMLRLGDTGLKSIAPLKGMRLSTLCVEKTEVRDLSPLRNMKSLRMLFLSDTPVDSLEPLRGVPLRFLDVRNTKVVDMRPVAGMPLKGLRINGAPVRKFDFLRSLRELRALDPPELWRQVPGKEDNADRPQRFPSVRPPPPPRFKRPPRGFRDAD